MGIRGRDTASQPNESPRLGTVPGWTLGALLVKAGVEQRGDKNLHCTFQSVGATGY